MYLYPPRDGERDRQRDRQTERERETDRQRERETDRDRERDRETETERQRQRTYRGKVIYQLPIKSHFAYHFDKRCLIFLIPTKLM